MMSRPDMARSQTLASRAPYLAYPHDSARQEASYASHQHQPLYTRQHHSFYDQRGPPPPPPLHFRSPEVPFESYNRGPMRAAPYDVGYTQQHQQHRASLPSSSTWTPSTCRTSSSSPTAVKNSQPLVTYRGHIKTTKDAILLLAACDLKIAAEGSGRAPPRRVTRRLLDSERAGAIASGSIFVWEEREAGMRRWTDGKCWSASRVSGCFLTYRELEARKKPSSSVTGGPTSNLYKADGLIKQSFSMTTTSGRRLHIISYYTKGDVRQGRLLRVSEDPRFVGERGGEWGLDVDEHEFPDPISRAGELPSDLQSNVQDTSQSPPSSPISSPELGHMRKKSDSNGQAKSPSPEEGRHVFFKEVDTVRMARRDPSQMESALSNRSRESINALPAELEDEDCRPVRSPSGHWSAELPYRNVNGKRSFGEDGVSDDANYDGKISRPRLHRMRSSSMNSGLSDPYLAPLRMHGRTGAADHEISKVRSTHGGPSGFQERDSAVGALLSLRSSIGSTNDETSHSNLSGSTMYTCSPSISTPGTADSEPASYTKPVFSCTDRAALDRFSIRI